MTFDFILSKICIDTKILEVYCEKTVAAYFDFIYHNHRFDSNHFFNLYFSENGSTAVIYLDNEIIHKIDLSTVAEPYEFDITTEYGHNRIRVEQNRIAIISADCPDNVCVDMGYAWGFYTRDYQIPDESTIDNLISRVNYKSINISNNTVSTPEYIKLDLGGIAKGYASDEIVKIIKENDITSAIISLGGNIAAIGNKTDGQPWSVAIQDPFNSDKYIGAVYVSDKAIVTSGSYQRYFTSNGNIYHHIIDPNTGYPVNNNLASVSVISDSGMKADVLSTSLFVMGMEKAIEYQKKYKDFEVVFITNENEIYITSGLQNNFKSDRSFSIIE